MLGYISGSCSRTQQHISLMITVQRDESGAKKNGTLRCLLVLIDGRDQSHMTTDLPSRTAPTLLKETFWGARLMQLFK